MIKGAVDTLLAAVAVTLRTLGNTVLHKLLGKNRRLRQARDLNASRIALASGDDSQALRPKLSDR